MCAASHRRVRSLGQTIRKKYPVGMADTKSFRSQWSYLVTVQNCFDLNYYRLKFSIGQKGKKMLRYKRCFANFTAVPLIRSSSEEKLELDAFGLKMQIRIF